MNRKANSKQGNQKKYHVYNLLYQVIYRHNGAGAMRNLPAFLFLPQDKVNLAAIQAGERQALGYLQSQIKEGDEFTIIDVSFLYASHLGYMTEAEFEEGAQLPEQPQTVSEEQLIAGLAEAGITVGEEEVSLPSNPFKM